jgi:hypothetical protein
MTPQQEPINGSSPADLRPHSPWPLWRKVLAYVLLLALALVSIWYIDRKVHKYPSGVAAPRPLQTS